MARDNPEPGFDDLDRRIRSARERTDQGKGAERADQAPQRLNFGTGLAVGIELIAGVVMGLGLGYALDGWLGTRPFLTILFFLLGTAAGMLNAWRHLVRIGLAGQKADGDGGDGAG